MRAAMVDDPVHTDGPVIATALRGQANPYQDDGTRQAAYRSLLCAELDNEAIGDIRLALSQNQRLGNSRLYATIETMTGKRREPKSRGRPRKHRDEPPAHDAGQRELLI